MQSVKYIARKTPLGLAIKPGSQAGHMPLPPSECVLGGDQAACTPSFFGYKTCFRAKLMY